MCWYLVMVTDGNSSHRMAHIPIPCCLLRGGGRVVRRCWVKLQWRGVLLIWLKIGHGPTVLAVAAGEGCLDILLPSVISLVFPLSQGDGSI